LLHFGLEIRGDAVLMRQEEIQRVILLRLIIVAAHVAPQEAKGSAGITICIEREWAYLL
jgi:hypothetical protein